MTKRQSILSLVLGGILLSIPQAYSQQIKSRQTRKPAVKTSAVSTQSWKTFVSADGTWRFQYPRGWRITKTDDTSWVLTNPNNAPGGIQITFMIEVNGANQSNGASQSLDELLPCEQDDDEDYKILECKNMLINGRSYKRELSESHALSLKTQAPTHAALEQYWPERDVTASASMSEPEERIAGDAPVGTFFDYATVHLLTTATLERLRKLYPQGRFEARRFRPNIVVKPGSDVQDFIENEWVGHILSIGEEVRLQITDPCPRCVMTTLPQGDLPRDLGILRTAVQQHRPSTFRTESSPERRCLR